MKYLILTLFTISISTFLTAQSVSDALRFGRIESASTARMAGIGGGMSALGGEFSVINVNPAGLAIYRSSEFSITPSFDLRSTTGRLAGRNNTDLDENTAAFSFSNVGVVLHSKPRGKWRTSNLAIGYNRIADFKENFNFRGRSAGSMSDQFLELTSDPNGRVLFLQELDDFLAGPGFDAGAIGELFDFDGNFERYFNDFEDAEPGAEVERLQSLSRRGSISELSLSLAGNYNNKFLIGGSVGFPIINYSQSRQYEEFDPGTEPGGNIFAFENLQFFDTLSTEGIGVNVKLGIIYWPTPKFRIGAAVHTPSFYALTDFYDTSVDYTYTNPDPMIGVVSGRGLPAQPRDIEYGFRTPWRFIGSGGLIVPKFGLITAEVEYVNYAGSRYNLDKEGNSIFDVERGEEVNASIDNQLQSGLNVRVGAEYKIERYLVRAGYNWMGAARTDRGESRNRISLGGGYRADRYYLDLAYVRGTTQSEYSPYDLRNDDAEQRVDRTLNSNRIFFTFGYRF